VGGRIGGVHGRGEGAGEVSSVHDPTHTATLLARVQMGDLSVARFAVMGILQRGVLLRTECSAGMPYLYVLLISTGT
jgi:hypothetical protein